MSVIGFAGAHWLAAAIAAERLDALIAASPENLFYTVRMTLATQG
jgi:hypothetical protein